MQPEPPAKKPKIIEVDYSKDSVNTESELGKIYILLELYYILIRLLHVFFKILFQIWKKTKTWGELTTTNWNLIQSVFDVYKCHLILQKHHLNCGESILMQSNLGLNKTLHGALSRWGDGNMQL